MTTSEILQHFHNHRYFCSDGRSSPKALHKLERDVVLRACVATALGAFDINTMSFSNIVFLLKHNVVSPPLCPVCSTVLNFDKAASAYNTTCSTKCGAQYSQTKTFKLRDVTKDPVILKKRIGSRKSAFRTGVRAVLSDYHWLHNEHAVKMRSLGDIATDLDVTYSVVAAAVKELNVRPPSKTELREASNLRKYGVNNVGLLPSVRDKAKQTEYARRGKGWKSTGEQQLFEFIRDVCGDTVQQNVYGIIPSKELDVYIPDRKIALEYCGLYWHSDKFKHPSYHKDKLDACTQVGIRLITIFEDEWELNKDLVKSKLKHIFGVSPEPRVYARQCTIVKMSTNEKDKFFNATHIQGSGPGSVTFGLVHNGQNVAAMTFIKQADHSFILNRYSTSGVVVGGFDKLLQHFKRTNTWKRLTSFADQRWSLGTLYEQTGWTPDKTLPPDYYWCKNGKRYHKFGFRHKHLTKKLTVYDPSKTENENCKNNGYVKLFNCGLIRYVMTNSQPLSGTAL